MIKQPRIIIAADMRPLLHVLQVIVVIHGSTGNLSIVGTMLGQFEEMSIQSNLVYSGHLVAQSCCPDYRGVLISQVDL